MAGVLDLIEQLVDWSRVGTFDEEPGEREVYERASDVLARHKRAA